MLKQTLKAYGDTDIYPFHMPGHKRKWLDATNPYEIDITEIEGFDNLHEAGGILLSAQKRAAALYGSKECFYLVNGSTCGLLAAISAAVSKGGQILVARNSHKAVYNGIFLRELEAVYVYPTEASCGILGQIQTEDIRQALEEHPQVEAVLITSPTYDGVVSDIRGIAEAAHTHGIPLIVDAAHGAHLGFSGAFPQNPIQQGVDVVIESVHKTLPAFTQTALLHMCSDRVSTEKIKKYLAIYETSSPSYILMAGIDECIGYLEKNSKEAFEALQENLDDFYRAAEDLKNLHVLRKEELTREEAFDYDYSKILIFSNAKNYSGMDLHNTLLADYHIEVEMISGQYVLALCSIMDTREGFDRLQKALHEIDAQLEPMELVHPSVRMYQKRKVLCSISVAENAETQVLKLQDAVGKAAAEYIYLYPPGIPMIVPGEEISEEFIEDIEQCLSSGLRVEGLHGKNSICIVNFF